MADKNPANNPDRSIKSPEMVAEDLFLKFEQVKARIDASAEIIKSQAAAEVSKIEQLFGELGVDPENFSPEDWHILLTIEDNINQVIKEFFINLEAETVPAESGKDQPEKKELRENILAQLNAGLEILKNIPEDSKTARIKWVIKSVEEAVAKAKDSTDLRFEVSIDNHGQPEGIPVDDLIEELNAIILNKEKEAEKINERKKELASMQRLAKDLKKQYDEAIKNLGRDKPEMDQEHQEKIAWHSVYNNLSDSKQTIRGRLRQLVDAQRQDWAKSDKAAGNAVPLAIEGNDYAVDSDFFALQTGEALRQVTEKIESDGIRKIDQDQLDKLNQELEKIGEIIKTLQANSKAYFEIRPDMQGDKQHWRTELEAFLVSNDLRSTGDLDKDYELAMSAMDKRREIVLPEDKKEPPLPKTEPLQLTDDYVSAGQLEVIKTKEPPKEEVRQIIYDPTKHELVVPEEKKQERAKVVIVDISEVVKAMAWREAEQKLRGMMDKANSNFLKRAFVRLGEKGYLMKYYKEALTAIQDNKNLMAEIEARILTSGVKSENQDKSYEILDSILEEFTREVVDADEKGDLVQDEEANLVIGQLFADYATSAMTRAEFDQAVEDNVIGLLKSKGNKFGLGNRQKEAEGLMYTNSLFSMAESYRKQYESQVDELSKEFGPEQKANIEKQIKSEMALDIQLGLKQKDLYETKPKPVLKWYEKFVDLTENIPILNKVIANPVTYGVVGGVAGSLAGKGVARLAVGTAAVGIAPWLAPLLVGAGLGGTFTAMRRSRDLQYDRGMDLRRATLGMESGGARTDKMREFNYDVKRAEDLQAELSTISGKAGLSEDDRKIIADIIARLDVEKEKSVDLIGVSEAEGEEHKTKLIAMKDLKVALKDLQDRFNLSPNDEAMQALIDEAKTSLIVNIESNDKNFSRYRRQQMFKSGLFGACAGLAAGAVGQWGVGKFSEYVLGQTPKTESALEHLSHYIRGDQGSAGEGALTHLTIRDGQLINESGQAVFDKLPIDAKTGQIDPATLAELKSQGIIVGETHSHLTESASVAGKLQEGLGKYARADWHDEPGKKMSSFFNRLIEHEGKQQMMYLSKDATGNVMVDASKILDNLSANANSAVKEFGLNPDGSVDTKLAGLRDQLTEWANKGELAKHIKVAIFPTEGANKAGMSYLTESADGSGKISLGETISKLFTAKDSLKDGHIPFRFGELRIIDEAGNSHVLATISGKDIDPTIMSQTVTDKFDYSFDLPNKPVTDWDVPPVLPFDPRRPLEGQRKKQSGSEDNQPGPRPPQLQNENVATTLALEDLREQGNVPETLPVTDGVRVGGGEVIDVTATATGRNINEEEEPLASPTVETAKKGETKLSLAELLKDIPLNAGELTKEQKKEVIKWLKSLTSPDIVGINLVDWQIRSFKKLLELTYLDKGKHDFKKSSDFVNSGAKMRYESFRKKFKLSQADAVLDKILATNETVNPAVVPGTATVTA